MEDVLSLIGKDLTNLELSIQKLITTKVAFIKEIVNYIIRSGGKRVRPVLVILTSKLCGYQEDLHIPYAAIIEFIHTATLLHDDVVDNAKTRRGSSTVNTVWGNEPSVLVGDFLYSKSFELMAEDGNPEILKIISRATTALSEGEMLEVIQTADIDTTAEEYFEVIGNKTAVLLSAASEVGAILGRTDEARRLALRKFGYDLGVAFQLKDDILDYMSFDNVLGKQVGTDLKEGKITLPLIYTLRQATDRERSSIKRIVEKNNLTRRDFERVRNIILKHGGIEYTSAVMSQYTESAKGSLSTFEPSPYKSALLALTDYMLKREM
jgi:octaprenyl-diphosphate synthase